MFNARQVFSDGNDVIQLRINLRLRQRSSRAGRQVEQFRQLRVDIIERVGLAGKAGFGQQAGLGEMRLADFGADRVENALRITAAPRDQRIENIETVDNRAGRNGLGFQPHRKPRDVSRRHLP